MRGYEKIMELTKQGLTVEKVFVYVDAYPLIKDGEHYVKTFQTGIILIDPLDLPNKSFKALRDSTVFIYGDNDERVTAFADLIWDAQAKRIVYSTPAKMEIWQ
jgi:hypothetical protein